MLSEQPYCPVLALLRVVKVSVFLCVQLLGKSGCTMIRQLSLARVCSACIPPLQQCLVMLVRWWFGG